MKSHLNNIKMVAFDIGKTIFDKEVQTSVDEEVLKTIIELKRRKIKVGVCTMRTYKSCLELIKVPLDFYICLNGTFIVLNGKIIQNIKIKNEFINEDYSIYNDNDTFYKNENSLKIAEINGFICEKQGFLEEGNIFTLFNISDEICSKYNKKYKTSYWKNTKTLTLQSKETSSFKALELIKNTYKLDDYLYFGDGPNDLEIFINHNHCVMVENGLPELKKYAYDTCESCFNKGVAKYLNRYVK